MITMRSHLTMILATIASLIVHTSIASEDLIGKGFEDVGEKIYVSPDQLVICDKGIFVDFVHHVIPISAVFHDRQGIYFLRGQTSEYTLSQCPKGHPSTQGDGRCNQKDCPHYRNK